MSATKSDLKPLLEILDGIGAVKWKINKKVLNVVETLWSMGGGLGKMPPRYNEKNIIFQHLKDAKGLQFLY